jgi:hypothetical protein
MPLQGLSNTFPLYPRVTGMPFLAGVGRRSLKSGPSWAARAAACFEGESLGCSDCPPRSGLTHGHPANPRPYLEPFPVSAVV